MTALYKVIEDASTDDVVSWLDDQRSFQIWRPNAFEELLPKYFNLKCSFHTWRQRAGELGFERLPVDGRVSAKGRTTLMSNAWIFTHEFFCRALVNNLLSAEEYHLKVWPFDGWKENIRLDYAWMATMNPGQPLQLNPTEQEQKRSKRKVPTYTETKFPVY
jgi:hypothetical protein